MNKKVLYISTRLFWPKNSGKKITAFFNAKGMHEMYNYDVYLYTFLEVDQVYDNKDQPDFIKEVKILKNPSIFTKLYNIIFKTIFGTYSIQSSLFYSKRNKDLIEKYILEIKPDIVIVDMIRLSRYYKSLKSFEGIKVINLDDLLSLRYERQLSEVTSKTDIGGQYTKKSSGVIKRLLKPNWLKRLILSFEAKKVKKEELKTVNWYDHAYFVSNRETLMYNMLTHTKKGECITMGVDTDYFGKDINVQKVPNRVSFVGNYYYSANVDSLQMIANKILPLVKHPIELYAIGPVSDETKASFMSYPNIKFSGEVDDLRMHVHSSEIALIPIAYGTGIKTKVVEALAMGMPIITNRLGVEGLDVENMKHLLISNEPETIALSIDNLLDDKALQHTLSTHAKAYAISNHTWSDIWKDLSKIGFKKD